MNAARMAILKSYARALLIAELVALQAGATGWQPFAWAAAFAILGPSLRAVDTKDAAGFGRVARELRAVLEARAQGKP